VRTFVRHYGASPLHLLVLIASFALAGYAAWLLIGVRPVGAIVWFAGAAVAHDLVLLPLYAIADGGLARLSRTRVGARPPAPWLNYIRFPAAISMLLLLVFLPSIARLSDVYPGTTGLSTTGFFARWLAVTGVLFLIAAVAYAIRLHRSR
jgi:hypothetical protein